MSLTYKDLEVIKKTVINELWYYKGYYSYAKKKNILDTPASEFNCNRKKVYKLKSIIKKIEREQQTNY
jgi:hypothetical protein